MISFFFFFLWERDVHCFRGHKSEQKKSKNLLWNEFQCQIPVCYHQYAKHYALATLSSPCMSFLWLFSCSLGWLELEIDRPINIYERHIIKHIISVCSDNDKPSSPRFTAIPGSVCFSITLWSFFLIYAAFLPHSPCILVLLDFSETCFKILFGCYLLFCSLQRVFFKQLKMVSPF